VNSTEEVPVTVRSTTFRRAPRCWNLCAQASFPNTGAPERGASSSWSVGG